jgi:hypothetical protein
MRVRSLVAVAVLALASAAAAGAGGGCDEELFEQFVTMRGGDGSRPVFWYAIGELTTYPEGETVAVLEGLGADRLVREEGQRLVAHQLHREVFVYRDPKTNEVLREHAGQPIAPLKMPYQYFTYRLEGDRLTSSVEHGRGDRVRSLGPLEIAVRRVGGASVFSMPLFVRGPRPALAHYDFFLGSDDERPRYHVSWLRFNDYPRAPAPGRSLMHTVSWRIDRFEDVPETIRGFIEREAPMYARPPRDLAEIRRLQQAP